MNNRIPTVLLVSCLAMAFAPLSQAADTPPAALLGVWQAHSMVADGKPAPAEHVEQMRFTFQADKLLVRGNYRDAREEACQYQVDASRSPKQLDFTPATEKKPILAIYRLEGDKLTLCLRHANSPQGRPTEFASQAGTKLVLIEFQRQQP